MKGDFESKEKLLKEENETFKREMDRLTDRLRKLDDGFRVQYDVEKREHLKMIAKLNSEWELKVRSGEEKVEACEAEMRAVLKEMEAKKSWYEGKLKSFTSAFQDIQADFVS